MLEEAVRVRSGKKLTADQLDRTLRELGQFSAKIPEGRTVPAAQAWNRSVAE